MIRFSGHSGRKADVFKRTQTIGIIASAPETDTATASIALANYYKSAKGYNTALAVAARDKGFSDMLTEAKCISPDPPGYSDGKLDYYIYNTREDIDRLMHRDFDRVVVDFGYFGDGCLTEDLIRIDRIIALISTTPWRTLYTREFLFSTIISKKELRPGFRNMAYSVAGTTISDRAISREFSIGIESIADIRNISDPYRLTKEDLRIISRFA